MMDMRNKTRWYDGYEFLDTDMLENMTRHEYAKLTTKHESRNCRYGILHRGCIHVTCT